MAALGGLDGTARRAAGRSLRHRTAAAGIAPGVVGHPAAQPLVPSGGSGPRLPPVATALLTARKIRPASANRSVSDIFVASAGPAPHNTGRPANHRGGDP